MYPLKHSTYRQLLLLGATLTILAAYSCNNAGEQQQQAQQAVALPVLKVVPQNATTFTEYPASLEGKVNVEIRPRVDGYLEEIYVDEGTYVKAGQPLFKINDRNYREQSNTAQAGVRAAQANVEKAQLEVERLEPLVANNIVSEVQLKSARAALSAAKASVAQNQAMAQDAGINVGYTLITAPVSGYIGRLPFKKGSLVGRGELQPLTVISDVSEVYAYFSMSENDYLAFEKTYTGSNLQDKVKQLPAAELQLADNSLYPEKGKVEIAEGQFNKTTGAISFRVTFPNAQGVLRTGNTGKVRIPKMHTSVVAIPQESTYEVQDKVFVFTVEQGNKVSSKPIAIAGKNNYYYFVADGLKPGEQIVYSGLGQLKDGAQIQPQNLSMDSLLSVHPL